MQDTPNDISDELSSFLMPLDFFYSKNKSKLPKVFPVQDSNIPQTERKLLAHQSDMTSTLTNHHGSDLFIEVLDNELNEHYLLRMVVLKKMDDSKPVEFGAIGIDLSKLNIKMVEEIKEGAKPLGKLLELYDVKYHSDPRAYFQVEIDEYISKILDSPIHEISYGRCNEITDSQGFTIADIVEVLPHSN